MLTLKSKIEEKINLTIFYILTFFPFVHLLCYINVNGHNLSIINTLTTLMYVMILYVWAVFVNKKKYIAAIAIIMGISSVLCVLISLNDLGSNIYDAMFAGAAILTVFFVFENTDSLLMYVNKNDNYLSFIIISFVVYSAILFLFFPSYEIVWGEGTYYFGHRYASVCSCMMVIIGLKLTVKSNHRGLYWLILLMCFLACYTTGARVYAFANLGIFYAVIYTYSKNFMDFTLKCVLITIMAIVVMFNSSIIQKTTNISDAFLVEVESQPEAENEPSAENQPEAENEPSAENNMSSDKSETSPEMKLDITGREYGFFDGVSNGRLTMWNNCINSYIKLSTFNKVFGSGNKYMYDNNLGLHSHQDFLTILHFNGALGLSVYLITLIGYVAFYWKNKKLPVILLIGFWGVWFFLALLNGYANYTANMISLPYIAVLANYMKTKDVSNK